MKTRAANQCVARTNGQEEPEIGDFIVMNQRDRKIMKFDNGQS